MQERQVITQVGEKQRQEVSWNIRGREMILKNKIESVKKKKLNTKTSDLNDNMACMCSSTLLSASMRGCPQFIMLLKTLQ